MVESHPSPADGSLEGQLEPQDVDALVHTLDDLDLEPGPKALLSAIIAVATHPPVTTTPPGATEPPITLHWERKFSEQFTSAFIQGQIPRLNGKVSLIGRTVAT